MSEQVGLSVAEALAFVTRGLMRIGFNVDEARTIAEDFKKQLADLAARVKSTSRQPGVDEILVPSERAFRERERRRVEGISLERRLYDRIAAL